MKRSFTVLFFKCSGSAFALSIDLPINGNLSWRFFNSFETNDVNLLRFADYSKFNFPNSSYFPTAFSASETLFS